MLITFWQGIWCSTLQLACPAISPLRRAAALLNGIVVNGAQLDNKAKSKRTQLNEILFVYKYGKNGKRQHSVTEGAWIWEVDSHGMDSPLCHSLPV